MVYSYNCYYISMTMNKQPLHETWIKITNTMVNKRGKKEILKILYDVMWPSKTGTAHRCWWTPEGRSPLGSRRNDSSFGVTAMLQPRSEWRSHWVCSLWKTHQTVHSWLYFKLQYLTKTTAANTQVRMARVSPLSPGIHPLQVALCLCPAGAVSVHSFHCFFLLTRFHRFPLFCPSLSLWTWHSDPDPSSTCVALGADFSFSASVSVFH